MAKPAPIFIGELYSGLFTELGKLHINDKGNAQWVHPRGKIPIVYAVAD